MTIKNNLKKATLNYINNNKITVQQMKKFQFNFINLNHSNMTIKDALILINNLNYELQTKNLLKNLVR